MKRCTWPGNTELMLKYHDEEWGVPCYDDKKLFEYILLDTFQAGLSWEIILKKRKGFQKAFHNFNSKKIANYKETDIQRLLNDSNIIRNKLKIQGTITNAQKFLELQKEYGSFSNYLWKFVEKPIQNNFTSLKEIPAKTALSDDLSNDLKKRGWKFTGSTICYAFIQAAGLVNDHTIDCFRHKEIKNIKQFHEVNQAIRSLEDLKQGR